jgi:hypothetical protein
MMALIYHLEKNPSIKDKIRKEIIEKIGDNVDSLTYDSLLDLPLITQCIYEALRIDTAANIAIGY